MIKIVAAAILLGDATLTAPPPARHHTLIRAAAKSGSPQRICSEHQGFITSEGLFVDRYRGMEIARAAGQLIPRAGGFMQGEISTSEMLFSEDLW